MKFTLKEFLETGRMGDIELGISQEQVEALLGPPEDVSLTKEPIWKYGSLQVYFHANRLCLIGWYFLPDEARLPRALETAGYLPSRQTTLHEFLKFLSEVGLPFRVEPDRTVAEQVTYQVGPGIDVIFEREGEQFLLETIQWPGPMPAKKKGRPLTLSKRLNAAIRRARGGSQ